MRPFPGKGLRQYFTNIFGLDEVEVRPGSEEILLNKADNFYGQYGIVSRCCGGLLWGRITGTANHNRRPEKSMMITRFIEKTWFLWWMLANAIVVRWFCVLATRARAVTAGAGSSDEAEARYVLSWQLLRDARRVSRRSRRALVARLILNPFRHGESL